MSAAGAGAVSLNEMSDAVAVSPTVALFELEDEPWVPVYDRERCRDCGGRVNSMAGGMDRGGVWAICEGCMLLDGARKVSHTAVVGRRVNWLGWEEAAHCDECGWYMRVQVRGDDGVLRDVTADEVIDAVAHHQRARWQSRWGQHEVAEHEALVRQQKARRAAWAKRSQQAVLR